MSVQHKCRYEQLQFMAYDTEMALPLIIFSLMLIGMPLAVSADACVSDEFNGSALDGTRWDVFKGSPRISAGNLILAGTSGSRAEVQSKKLCMYGVLQTSITSADWKIQSIPIDDSSFGFENFTGTNGQCHYAVILVANGDFGLLQAVPDALGNCYGDPPLDHQKYIKISNWDAVMKGAGGRINITLNWSPNKVISSVSDGGLNTGKAAYTGAVVPALPLKLRLNAHCKKRMEGDNACNSAIDETLVMGLIDLSYLKTVSVDKQPYYGIMKQFRLGEANGLPGQPLDACA